MRSTPRAPNTIAVLLPSLAGGGAERIMLNLIEGLLAKQYDVDLVLVSAFGEYLPQVPEAVNIVDLRSQRALRALFPLTRYLKRREPALLISSLGHVNLVALKALRLARTQTRIIVSEHLALELNPTGLIDRVYRVLARWAYPSADAIVAVSGGVADNISKITKLDREKFQVIYNPVLPQDFWNKAREEAPHPWLQGKGPPVILGVGRLTHQKDFPNLLNAFALLRKSVDARLIILGEGPDRGALEALASKLNIAESVSMPGFVDNPYAFMAAADVFALSSRREGLPTVLIEAIAAGAAVVSTDCPSGPQEILEGGRFGELVPIEDHVALAKALEKVLTASDTPVIPRQELDVYTPEVAASAYLKAAGM